MIYTFETKTVTNQFLDAFVKTKESKRFGISEPGTPETGLFKGQWQDFDFKITDENIEIAFQGIIRGTHKLKPFLKNHTWYYFDQPYFFYSNYQVRPDFNDRWYRINKNNVQKNFIHIHTDSKERYEKRLSQTNNPEEITPKRWRKEGKHILIIPPSFHTAHWYEMDEEKWIEDIKKELRKHTDREIRVRYKYKEGAHWGARNKTPLSEDLKDCWAMVSWHSMTANEGIIAGVPGFTSEHSPARPVSLGLDELNKIENPLLATNRMEWLYSLMSAQFTLEEMRSGYAYEVLNEY